VKGSALIVAFAASALGCASPVRVGSKQFVESAILAEIVVHLGRAAGLAIEHRRGLGGTKILWRALERGEIDLYPEYTGTLREEILRDVPGDEEALRQALRARGIEMSRPLGFSNTYAVGMKEKTAARLGIRTISDLRRHPGLRLGFSNEFMSRRDGWPGLRDRYRLPQRDVRGLQHDLATRALESGAIDATDLYETDPEIPYHRLRVLADDLGHFPAYEAVLLYRADLPRRAPGLALALRRLEGRIDTEAMRRMNARAKLDRIPATRVAAELVTSALGVRAEARSEGVVQRILRHTGEHLVLVAISLFAAIAVAVPLGVVAARRPRAGQLILGAAGVVQTVPSLALLVFMIPLLGIGGPPAVVALFLYSLLPIVRNTAAGLGDIPPPLRESAAALGLPPFARLRLVELPMASGAILAGIKTSAVLNVGTATLGALIGAGGYGQPILTGIQLDDVGLILQGAVPAAVLALAVQGLFDLLERVLVPKGLRVHEHEPKTKTAK
jgi:osmoprotectant transport system permease protein